jgi:hypothetical protein
VAQDGALIKAFEARRVVLKTAQNLGQFEAMERKLVKGRTVTWCDNGYGWVYDQKVGDFRRCADPLLPRSAPAPA